MQNSKEKKNVLLVEDEIIIGLGCSRALMSYGYEISIAKSGEEALEMIRSSSNIDLVLMDIDLGEGIDGTQTAEAILKDKEIPIVFLSSHTEQEIVRKTEKITSYGYIVKGSSTTVLDASIKMAFKLFYSNQRLQNEVSKHKKTEGILRKSEERFRAISEQVPFAIIIHRDGIILYANAAAVVIFGADSSEDLVGSIILERVHPDYHNTALERANKIIERKIRTPLIEQKLLKMDGSVFTVEVQSSSVIFEGEFAFHTFINDITERKKAEKLLQDSEENLAVTLSSIGDGVIATDVSGIVTRMNQTAERLTSWKISDAIGRPLFEIFNIIDSQTKKPLLNPLQLVLERNESIGSANYTSLTSRDGTVYHIHHNATTICDSSGINIGVVLVFSDVSEKFEMQKALLKTTELLEKTGELAKVGGWQVDLQSMKLTWTIQTFNIAGIDPPNEPPLEEGINLFAPEVRPIIQAAINKTIVTGIPYDLELPIINAKGIHKWVQTQGFAEMQDGKAIRLFGTFQDITNRKIAEIELKISEAKFQVIFEQAALGVAQIETDTDRFLKINKKYCHILGYTQEEIYDLNFCNLTYSEDLDNYIEKMELLKAGSIREFTIDKRIIKKNGELTWLRLTVSPMWQIGEQSSYHIAIVQEISEYKRAEEDIKSLLIEKEMILKEVHHRIKNNMGVIQSLLLLHSNSLQESSAIEALEDAGRRVNSMSILYDKLYQSINFSEVSVLSYLPILVDDIIANFPNGNNVTVIKEIDDLVLDAKKMQIIGIIINELLTNAMKYAFINKDEGTITISFKSQNQTAYLMIKDDGIGKLDTISLEEKNGFGMMLIRQLSKQINASIRFETDNGTKVFLEMKL